MELQCSNGFLEGQELSPGSLPIRDRGQQAECQCRAAVLAVALAGTGAHSSWDCPGCSLDAGAEAGLFSDSPGSQRRTDLGSSPAYSRQCDGFQEPWGFAFVGPASMKKNNLKIHFTTALV